MLEYGLLLLLSTLWGSSFSFLKLTVASVPPLTAIAWRTAIAGRAAVADHALAGHALPRDWESWKSFIIVSAVNTVFPFMLIAWGLQYVDASLAVILNSTTPIFAFLITWGITRQEADHPAQAVRRCGRHHRHRADRRHVGAVRARRAAPAATRDRAGVAVLRDLRHLWPRASARWTRWRPPAARC